MLNGRSIDRRANLCAGPASRSFSSQGVRENIVDIRTRLHENRSLIGAAKGVSVSAKRAIKAAPKPFSAVLDRVSL